MPFEVVRKAQGGFSARIDHLDFRMVYSFPNRENFLFDNGVVRTSKYECLDSVIELFQGLCQQFFNGRSIPSFHLYEIDETGNSYFRNVDIRIQYVDPVPVGSVVHGGLRREYSDFLPPGFDHFFGTGQGYAEDFHGASRRIFFLLEMADGLGDGGIAGQDNDRAPGCYQGFDARVHQGYDFGMGTIPVRAIFRISKIFHIPFRIEASEFGHDREATDSGIEKTEFTHIFPEATIFFEIVFL